MKRQDDDRFKDLGSKLSALKKESPESPPIEKSTRVTRHVSIHFRTNQQEYAMIQTAADRMGLTLSSFVRLSVREKLGLV